MLGTAHSVVAIFESNDREIARVRSRHLSSHCVRFRPTRHEKYDIETIRQLVCELFCIQTVLIIHINCGGMLELVDLLFHL